MSGKKGKEIILSFAMILIIVSVVLCLDQLSKLFIVRNLSLNESIPVLKNIFHITLVHNQGAAFGILKGGLIIFVFTAFVAICLILNALRSKEQKSNFIYRLSLSLILGGGLGNLIDRVFLGYVVDFLDFRIWPVFNVADSAITIGAILLGWSILRTGKCTP